MNAFEEIFAHVLYYFILFSLVELQRQKEKLLKERDEQISDNQKLREQIEETRNRVAICQNELLEAQNKITELTVDLQVS